MSNSVNASSINWQVIEDVGFPPPQFRMKTNGHHRTFLIKGQWSLLTGYMHSDGSGFDIDSDDVPVAWAIIEGF